MKTLKPGRLALTFAGCFLGAGYVSGQELWQFFGQFGLWGLAGLLLAMGLLCAFGVLLLRLAVLSGCVEMDKLIICWEKPALRRLVAFLELLFLLGIFVIMAAGAGALAAQLFAVPSFVGSAVFSLAVALIAIKGLGGMVSAFSATVPLLVACTVCFAVAALLLFPGGESLPLNDGSNPLLGNWFFSSLSFASYNLFSSIGVLAPLGLLVADKRSARRGVLGGGGFLLLIAGSVLLALTRCPSALGAELPMLALSQQLHPALGYLYGLLLFCGMLGTSVSSLVAVLCYMEEKRPRERSRRPLWSIVLAAVTFAASLLGFGNLIGTVYPISGYCGMVFLVCLWWHYRRCCKAEKTA